MNTRYYSILSLLFIGILFCSCTKGNDVVIYPAPSGIELNQKFSVTVNGKNVPVYNARVCVEDREERHKGIARAEYSEYFYDIAGMAYFDMRRGPVTVSVAIDEPITSAKVLPTSEGIIPKIQGHKIVFEVHKPQNLTIDINGDIIRSLHLFVNEEEKDVPDPNDPNVIYFGPGIHDVTSMVIDDNKTVYVAGGAFIRGIIGENERFRVESGSGLKVYSGPTFYLRGKNITFRGRGIIDQTLCPTHARNLLLARGSDIKIEGVILHNSSVWTLPVRECSNVVIDNVKILGYRANADGFDICSSENVIVENCFARTMDDLVVIKSPKESGAVKDIIVRKCVLWNEVAHALSVGAELTKPVENVLFTDCDIIHDHCREWSLRVYQCDAGLVKNIRFENIRIEESVKFISLWIGSAVWSTDSGRGNIRDIVFKDITVRGDTPLKAEFKGFDSQHTVENVLLENITINGNRLTAQDVISNEFVSNVTIKP